MNYRHIYHAGNLSDVFKHALYAYCLAYMNKKEAAYRVLDCHAALGFYPQISVAALKTGEMQAGYKTLLASQRSQKLDAFLAPFLEAQRLASAQHTKPIYAASPEIALRLSRPQDKLLLIEKHPQDYEVLKENYAWSGRAKALNRDAYESAKAYLPPPEKRALVLFDPPFEEENEEQRLVRGFFEAYSRFPQGVYVLWYPIKTTARFKALEAEMKALKLDKCLHFTFEFFARDEVSLSGCGVYIINPPFTLEAEFKAISVEFVRALKLPQGKMAVHRL